jgi:hypothetical protein
MTIDRRKVILGSGAVPLILTVRPAAAQARSSYSCIERDARRSKPYNVLASAGEPDEWLRVRADVFQLTIRDQERNEWKTLENRQFILGADRSTYWELDRLQPFSAPAHPTAMNRGTGIKETKMSERLALAYLGPEGEIRGYGWEPRGGTHCTKSCWASFAPGARSALL